MQIKTSIQSSYTKQHEGIFFRLEFPQDALLYFNPSMNAEMIHSIPKYNLSDRCIDKGDSGDRPENAWHLGR